MHDVERRLLETDDLFASLVASWELDGCAAQRIESVRDDLSSNLVAVAAMAGADVPTAGVLRRAVDAAKCQIETMLTSGRACGVEELRQTCLREGDA